MSSLIRIGQVTYYVISNGTVDTHSFTFYLCTFYLRTLFPTVEPKPLVKKVTKTIKSVKKVTKTVKSVKKVNQTVKSVKNVTQTLG